MPEVTVHDFARSFGTTAQEIQETCSDLIQAANFQYSVLEGEERDRLILSILKRIDADRQVIGADERQAVWEKGWEENLNDFIDSGYDLNKLVPRFIRPDQPVRLEQRYIKPADPNFELSYFNVLRQWIFKKYFALCPSVYEFGCGTGFNLVALARLFPEKRLYGLDFVTSSVRLVNAIGDRHKLNLKGRLFDMLKPDASLPLEPNAGVLTIGSIEQLASRFEAFFGYLLDQPLAVCVHIEPAIELYDESVLEDYLAIKFQGKRGYTHRLIPYLKNLEETGAIEILLIKRFHFGSLFMEGYNGIVWRPKNRQPAV